MNKKLLSLVLSLVMVLGTFTSAFAAETTTTTKTDEKLGEKVETVEKVTGKDNKIQYIIDKKFVEGYENGDYGYDKNIKRSEITKLIVFANGNKELAEKLQGSMKLYNDVDTAFWANGVISVGTTVPSSANGQPMLNGYPDGSFKPEKNVTYAELAKMLVVLVKTDLTADMVKDANAKWATQWMSWAAQLGILDDVTVANSDAPATRADAFTMMYNALYKMQEFKRVPANDKIGVLSSLKKNELILNQDSEQTYKITDDTVFVKASSADSASNIIKVKNITDPDYYLGSLVRVMYNDNKEVTHILELGNPKFGALTNETPSTKYDLEDPNHRWEGVADATVSTEMYDDITTLNKIDDINKDSYVKFDMNSSNTKANYIRFFNENDEKAVLKINDNTKVYVANPYNNIMKEVDGINAALSLIGFRNYDGYKVPNVYAGFDTDGLTSAIHTETYKERNTAKVIVFNVVAKNDDGGKLYRVLESTATTGKATLEDVDGKVYDKDFFGNVSNFPYNYGDKFDVIKIGYKASEGSNVATKKIDYSKTSEFPIVKVVETYNDKKLIKVEDKNGYVALLDLRDADIFNAKQYKDLKEGDKVQFLGGGDNNKSAILDILSILPNNPDLDGSLRGIIEETVYGKTYVGRDLSLREHRNGFVISMEVYNDSFDKGENLGYKTYEVTTTEFEALELWLGQNPKAEVNFKVEEKVTGEYDLATDFRDNETNELIRDVMAEAAKVKNLITNLPVNTAVTVDNKDEVVAAREAYDGLTDSQKKFVDNLGKLEADESEIANQEEARQLIDEAKVEQTQEAKDAATAVVNDLQNGTVKTDFEAEIAAITVV